MAVVFRLTDYMDESDIAPTLSLDPSFDPASDAIKLYDAMDGVGTNEEAIISILGRRTDRERQEIVEKFNATYDKPLEEWLDSEVDGEFGRVCLALVRPLTQLLAEEMHRAMSGVGTDEGVLVEVLCSRRNSELQQVAADYERLFEQPLAARIEADTSGNLKALLLLMLKAEREELTSKSGREPSAERGASQAERLYAAGEDCLGTREEVFNLLVGGEDYRQLRLTAVAYEQKYGRSLSEAISSETSGDDKRALLACVAHAASPAEYFSERVRATLSGPGTKDKSLTRLLMSRAELDLGAVKTRYFEKYGQQLEDDVSDDTSGDYRKLLLALLQ